MIKPMLAERFPHPFNDPRYIWEIKRDGLRILSFVDGRDVHLQARSGSNKTYTFPELRIETKVPAILDSEVVSATGLSFQDSIQKRMNRIHNIESAAAEYPSKMVAFDCLEVNGENIESLRLEQRQDILRDILVPTDNAEISQTYEDGLALWEQVIANGWEGQMGKLKAGEYLRNKRKWLKVKAWKRNYGKDSTGEVFMVVGYTRGTGWRESTFGALLVARLEVDGSSTYVGEVGTGPDRKDLSAICAMFSPTACPWIKEPGPATWVKPFAIYMQYLEYTNDGIWRFPSFKGVC